jgi:rod shape-determining protein MreC
MKMLKHTNYQSNKASQMLIFLCVIVIAIFFSGVAGIGGYVRSVFHDKVVSSLLFVRRASADVVLPFRSLANVAGLAQRESELHRDNDYLRAQLADYKKYKSENVKLREMIGLRQDGDIKLEGAEIYMRQRSIFGEWIYINTGSEGGAQEGMLVIAGDSILIGFIDLVHAESSRVKLISHPETVLEVSIPDRGSGLLRYSDQVGLVVEEMQYSEGQITQSPVYYKKILSSGFLQSFLIGYISQVRPSDNQITQEALIDMGIDVALVDYVFIVLP